MASHQNLAERRARIAQIKEALSQMSDEASFVFLVYEPRLELSTEIPQYQNKGLVRFAVGLLLRMAEDETNPIKTSCLHMAKAVAGAFDLDVIEAQDLNG